MKLYSTITSERATKGQGGNEYLIIKVLNEDKEEAITLEIKPRLCINGKKIDVICHYDRYLAPEIIRIPWDLKGKRQKGEMTQAEKFVDDKFGWADDQHK